MSGNQVQMDLTFQAGLLEQFPHFRDVVRAAVYGCGRPLKIVAADLDMTSSELSRKLADNPNDPIHFPVDKLPDLIRATSDLRPIYWLAETFLEDDDAKKKRAVNELNALMQRLPALLKAVE